MAINWVCVELRVASEFIVNRMDGLRGLLPRNKRIRYAIYAVGGVLALLQLLFLVVFLASGDETLNTAPGQSAGGRDVADAADFWAKYFPHDNAVQWNDFAVYLLMEYARDIRNLTSSLTPALGGHFDVDNDGAVSRKEYNRFLRTYGTKGLEHGLQQAVDAAIDNNWRRDPVDRRSREGRGCAVELSRDDGTYIELEASSDIQFGGAKPFFIEAWIRPNAGKDASKFGGTIFSKYNRGRKGQYFIALEPNGGLFFHREVSPWGLRSNVRIPADVFTHIAVGYGGGRSKIYINGTLRGSQREGAQAVDVDTNVLVGAIHDEDRPGTIFDGTIDELRVWSVDRTQVELESNMHTTLTGLEYGLFGYWTFDECAGGRLRDRMGKHDGVMHGGRWLRSTVAIRTNQEIVHCPNKGKCSIDEVEARPNTGNAYVDEMMIQNDYWKRAIKIMESQNKVNKKIIRELLMTVDTLTNRMKWLESQDRIRHKQVAELNVHNINISETVARIHQNVSVHLTAVEEVCNKQPHGVIPTSLMAKLAGLSDNVGSLTKPDLADSADKGRRPSKAHPLAERTLPVALDDEPVDFEGLGGTDDALLGSSKDDDSISSGSPLDLEDGELPKPKKRRKKRPTDGAPAASHQRMDDI